MNREVLSSTHNLEGGGMSKSQSQSVWGSGAAYEPYVGRWSRLVAREFLTVNLFSIFR